MGETGLTYDELQRMRFHDAVNSAWQSAPDPSAAAAALAAAVQTHAGPNGAGWTGGTWPLDESLYKTPDYREAVAVFGHEGYAGLAEDSGPRKELRYIRENLRGLGAKELGFGVSPDGFSWAMFVELPRYNEHSASQIMAMAACRLARGRAFDEIRAKPSTD